MSLTLFFSLQKIEKGFLLNKGVDYSCNPKDGLFHKNSIVAGGILHWLL